jgi:predicted glutamine amidotransferase
MIFYNIEMDYQNGKIYKIQSHLGPKIYIGSTTKQYLSQRLTAHRGQYKAWKKNNKTKIRSYELFDEYGLENCEIVLVELYPCNSRDELTAKESHYIRTLDCVNRNLANRSKKEYYIDNRETILEQRNTFYNNNREEKKEKVKAYREKNKEALSEKYKLKCTCECGSTYRLRSKPIHEKSKKHSTFVSLNNQN